MADPAKKFSFGFTKTTKKPNLSIKPRNELKQDKQLIDCLEGKLIKVRGGEKKVEEKPLIIPLQPSSRRVLVKSENGESDQPVSSRIKQETDTSEKVTIKQEPLDPEEGSQPVQPNDTNAVQIKTEPTEPEPATLEEIAAREILREAEESQKKEDYSNLSVPALQDVDTLAAAPTVEDYESIPVSAFGKAMLKGMGWQEEAGIGKKPQLVATVEATGPKRLASSAEQAMRAAQMRTGSAANNTEQEELKLVKGAFVKVLSGAMKGEYGEVEGFTDECDRVLIKMALRGGTVSFSEAALQVVSKNDFTKNSRVLNSSKYEEVKNKVSKSLEAPSPEKSRSSSDSSPERRNRSPGRKRSPSLRKRRDRSPDTRDRSPDSRRVRSPDSRRARSPDPRRARSPDPRKARSPDSRKARSPDSRKARSPDSRKARSPDSRKARSPDFRKARSPDSRKERRDVRDRSASSGRGYKQSRKRSSRSPDRIRKKTDSYSDKKYSRRDSPRKTTPPRRRESPSVSPARESTKKSYEVSSKKSSREDCYSSRSVSPQRSRKPAEKSHKPAEKFRRDRSSDSDSDSPKTVKKSSKKKSKRRSSSASSSSDSDSPKKSSHKKKKKSHKKKKSRKRDSSSSPDRQKKSSKK